MVHHPDLRRRTASCSPGALAKVTGPRRADLLSSSGCQEIVPPLAPDHARIASALTDQPLLQFHYLPNIINWHETIPHKHFTNREGTIPSDANIFTRRSEAFLLLFLLRTYIL